MLKKRQNEVKRNIFLFHEVKNHSRTGPAVQFNEFSLTRQTNRSSTDNGENPLKKSVEKILKKNPENQYQTAACEQKNHKREIEIWLKRKSRSRMNS